MEDPKDRSQRPALSLGGHSALYDPVAVLDQKPGVMDPETFIVGHFWWPPSPLEFQTERKPCLKSGTCFISRGSTIDLYFHAKQACDSSLHLLPSMLVLTAGALDAGAKRNITLLSSTFDRVITRFPLVLLRLGFLSSMSPEIR